MIVPCLYNVVPTKKGYRVKDSYYLTSRKQSRLYTNPVNILSDYMRRRRKRMRRPCPGWIMRMEIASRYCRIHKLK